MPEYMINGIPVNFPFVPYSVQTDYMEKVIECLKKGVNGILESPTGTGKTLCLLCASLSWLTLKKAQIQAESHGALIGLENGDFITGLQNTLNNPVGLLNKAESKMWGSTPKIIYASRTHSQLTQAMQELRKTGYDHIKVSVIGSRDQMCIHPEVSQEENNMTKIFMCQVRTKSRSCYFYNNVDAKKEDKMIREAGILDIEDLVKVGRKLRCCPYFLAREMKDSADVIFMPYNYLLDSKSRKSHGIELQNNIVILDEAHNIEKICEQSASVDIRSTDVALCIQEITQVMKDVFENTQSGSDFNPTGESSISKDFIPEELCLLKTLILELEKAIDDIPLQPGGSTFPGGYIFELLAKAEITHDKSNLIIDLLTKISQYLATTSNSPFQNKGTACQKLVDLFTVVFSGIGSGHSSLLYTERIKKCFKLHVAIEEPKNKKQKSDSWEESKAPTVGKGQGRIISYWCFSPSFGMQQLLEQNLRCLILTSGTLSPLPPLISEIGIPVDVTLENGHVIKHNQVYVSIVPNGPDNHVLNSSYNTRNDPKYITSLGMTILNMCRVVPHGVLVFFPSYPIMNKCQEAWQQSGLWSKICEIKPIFVEPRSRDGFNNTITEYYSKIHDPAHRGACFMAVMRGKVSEGLDFMDFNGRAVVVTGLPFPPAMDPHVVLKQRYLSENEKKDGSQCLSAQQWYLLEASRAVNQAIGRVIRHKDDYGAILLCDVRFSENRFTKSLSSWIQSHIRVRKNFGHLLRELREFYSDAERSLPAPKLKPITSAATDNTKISSNIATVPDIFDKGMSRSAPKYGSQAENKDMLTTNSSNWELDEYLNSAGSCSMASSKPGPSGNAGGKDFFGSLEKSASAIDFNNMNCNSPSSSSKSLFKWSGTIGKVKPAAKKLKLRVSAPKVVPTSQESVDMFAEEESVSKKCKLQITKADEKKKSAAIYCTEVKKSLDAECFRMFSEAIKSYRSDKDYDKVLNVLKRIFLEQDRKLIHLFKGFRRFLQLQDMEKFDQFCRSLSS